MSTEPVPAMAGVPTTLYEPLGGAGVPGEVGLSGAGDGS